MNIENILRQYKEKKSKVDIALARIGAWEKALQNPGMIVSIVNADERILGMPKGSFNITSPVERELCKEEESEQTEEKIIETIKELIQTEQSRIYWLKLEIDTVTIALQALSVQERFVVECKYFERMTWREIEIEYNKKYTCTTECTLKRKYKEIINKLEDITEPFCEKIA